VQRILDKLGASSRFDVMLLVRGGAPHLSDPESD
jgi:hypothetical protein